MDQGWRAGRQRAQLTSARLARGAAALLGAAGLALGLGAASAAAQEAGETGSDGRVAVTATAPAVPPLNDVAPVGARTEDPIAAAKREVYAQCLSAEFPETFARWEDLNADGEADALITYNVVCDGYRGALCGVEGCPGAVFVSDGDGGYRKTDLPPDATVAEPYRGLPAVAVSLTGDNCRRGVRLCRGVRVWNGAAFVPPDQLDAPAGAAGTVAAAPAPDGPPPLPEPTALEIAVAAEDFETTGALFDRIGPPPDPVIDERVDRLMAANALRAARGFRSFRPSEQWSYEPFGRGRARAWVRGEFGAAELQIACRAGDPVAAIAFYAREGVFGSAFRSGVAAPADVLIAGSVRDTVLLRYVRRRDMWVGRLNPQGPLLDWLRRGSSAVFLEPGALIDGVPPAARFSLTGSRRAIEAALRACGLI